MKETTFTFTIEEINTILKGLGELPFKESNFIIGKIHSQFSASKAIEEKRLQETTS